MSGHRSQRPALWTDEDDAIWHRVQGGWFGYLVGRSMQLDRGDAELMFSWQCQEMESLCMTRLERLLWLGIGLPVEYSA